MIKNISVTILTKNSSKYINECLSALTIFSEVIILDNGSTDATLEIANRFSNVRIFKHDFIGFGPLKILATEYATNDWILSIDSDEIVTSELISELKLLDKNKNTVYCIKRLNHYNGRLIKGCGWYPDTVKRLFNKKITNFNTNMVHESVISSKDCLIDADIKHYTCCNVSQMLDKMNKYTTMYAEQNVGKKNSSLLKAIISAKWSFIKSYFIKKGFLYGTDGLSISLCISLGAFFKHFKLLELNKFNKKSDLYLFKK